MSRFFIHRPIFAWVIAILIMLVGILAINNLPIEQYPKIAPPQVKVRAVYPGADAETVENSVTQIIEQQMKGIDGLMYMSSNSSAAGSASVTLTFENGTDPDTAQVQVQNKLQSAMSSLPETVQRTGLNVEKSASDFLMVTAFVSEDGSMDQSDIADYVATSIVDPISRVEGVGGTNVFGSSYAMRIWLDPAKLRAYNLIPSDVSSAIRSQNVQVSAGQLGTLPTNTDRVVINATVSVQSYLQTPEQFEDILLKTDTAGAQVRIKDVARVELGSENYQFRAQYNGQAASGLAIMLAPGANALEVREAVGVRLDELSQNFPTGLKMVVPYDTTPFVRLSITQVVYTLLEAVVLVFLVMFLFLQNWRATIIPTLAVPVVILGTFAVLSVFGYSINILTMFAMVLAIGLLVDDAIIVVENVERILEENPSIQVMDATIQSMREISKVVIGIALILSVVFVPMIFFGGSSGVIYRQFAVTLMTSMALSAFIALVFTPALCVTILKRQAHKDINIQTGFLVGLTAFFIKPVVVMKTLLVKLMPQNWRI